MKKIFKINKGDDIFCFSHRSFFGSKIAFFLALLNGSSFIYMSKYDLKNIIKLGKKFNLNLHVYPSNYLKLLKKNLINKSIKIKKNCICCIKSCKQR